MTAPTNEQAERAELRRLLAAATPGPWGSGLVGVWSEASGSYLIRDLGSDGAALHWSIADRTLIAAAVNALPRLLDALDAAEARIAWHDRRWQTVVSALEGMKGTPVADGGAYRADVVDGIRGLLARAERAERERDEAQGDLEALALIHAAAEGARDAAMRRAQAEETRRIAAVKGATSAIEDNDALRAQLTAAEQARHDMAQAATAATLRADTAEALLREARIALDAAARELFLLGADGDPCDEPGCTDHAAANARNVFDRIDAALPAKEDARGE